MMPQMESSEPIRERESSTYGRYEGDQGYTQQRPPYGSPDGLYDEDFVDSLAQRLSQRMVQGPAGKLQPGARQRVSPGQRLALAIVSVVMLVPLAATLVVAGQSVGAGIGGLFAFGGACLAIFLINAVFNDSHRN